MGGLVCWVGDWVGVRMCVSACVRERVQVDVRTCVCACACVYVCVCVSVHARVYAWMRCVGERARACMLAFTGECVSMCLRLRASVCEHAFVRLHAVRA